jgi:P4 family phage/plasmid primase-like protien
MILGALPVSFYPPKRYSTPQSWKVGERHPNQLKPLGFREALSHDWCSVTGNNQEVWLYPLAAQGGPVLRPSKEGRGLNTDLIKRELNIDLYTSGIFIDLDDEDAHKSPEGRSDQAFFDLVERTIEPFKAISGCFYYRTLRGARIGLIFETPVELSLGDRARRAFFLQLEEMFSEHDQIEVDKGSTQITRGFAAPHIYKKGERVTPDFAKLFIHPEDMSIDFINVLAERWTAHLKSVGDSAGAADSERGPKASQSAEAREGAEGQASRAQKKDKKPSLIIPYDLSSREIEGEEAYYLFRNSVFKLSHWIQDEHLLRELAEVLDRHICNGRRAEKGEVQIAVDNALDRATIHNIDELNIVRPPESVHLDDFPELKPLRRHFSYPLDDLKTAQAVLESMGDEPAPLWHGEGIRRYNPDTGTWKLYRKPQLERIFTKLEGAQVENDKGEFKDIGIKHALVTNGVKMLASMTGAGEPETPFDTAPMGVVLGQHFISAGLTGLKVQPRGPEYYAIHHLDYELSPYLLRYWQDEDSGHQPKAPPVFTRSFLARSLHRAPEERETISEVEQEIQAKIITIGEWLGLALLGLCTREATALVAHGPGSNGKSVLASLISDLFGAERTAHLAPQAMKERFSRAQLFGAAVNVVSEMPESDLLESDTIKAMISGDAITVEHKNEKPFRMIPRAAHFFAANTLPASRDRSHGLWRRLVPIEFHHIFTRADRDPDLLDKLRAEYDLLVPWALDLARQYIERGGYRHQDRIDQWRGSWRIETDALSAFIASQCELTTDPKDATPARELWREFKLFAEDVGQSGAAKMSLTAFTRSMSSQPNIIKRRKRPVNSVKQSAAVAHFNLKINNPTDTTKQSWKI